MPQDIFIGIEGGGTQSTVRVEDCDGNLLGQEISGPANIRLSVENAWRVINTTLENIVKPQGISLRDKNYRFHAGLGLAGTEVREAYHAFLDYPHFFTTLKLTSDAYIACLGAHQGAEGAVIIAGTGMIGFQIESGKESRVGGWGFPYDDEGSGAWLGLEATRLTLQSLDQRIEKSLLVEAIFSYFNQDQAKFITWASQANSSEFARLAPLVIQHSQQGESSALNLIKKAACAIDQIYQALLKMRVHTKNLPCCLLGGIAPFLEPWLSTELRSVLVARKRDANAGAILMIRDFVARDQQCV